MVKAFFLDFYGTVVYEDGQVVDRITRILCETGGAGYQRDIGRFWWEEFQRLCAGAYGANFEPQRALEYRSLETTIKRFGSTADARELSGEMFQYWGRPPIFPDARDFFQRSPLPIYLVSNIDRQDILGAVGFHKLRPAGIFTSEDARAYKPREELFRLALERTGLEPEEVIHIGDSLSSDVMGAAQAGIRALWLNRFGKAVPEGVTSIASLAQGIQYL